VFDVYGPFHDKVRKLAAEIPWNASFVMPKTYKAAYSAYTCACGGITSFRGPTTSGSEDARTSAHGKVHSLRGIGRFDSFHSHGSALGFGKGEVDASLWVIACGRQK